MARSRRMGLGQPDVKGHDARFRAESDHRKHEANSPIPELAAQLVEVELSDAPAEETLRAGSRAEVSGNQINP